MSHGDVAVGVGACPACGRENVTVTDRGYCVDQFACLAAWSQLPVEMWRVKRRRPTVVAS